MKTDNQQAKTQENSIVNFLATADVHAGYNDSQSSKTIASLKNKLNQNNNRGVIISGDLTSLLRDVNSITNYRNMIAPIHNHVLAGLGNHDTSAYTTDRRRERLAQMVLTDAQNATNLTFLDLNSGMPVYSWNWGGVHFVQVSLAPTDIDTTKAKNNFGGEALTKLKNDLYLNVGIGNNMPIVLSFHYGFDRFSLNPSERWWNNWQINKFKATVLKHFNVILMLTGHIHVERSLNVYYPVDVDGRTIYDALTSTSLYGGYSEISINTQDETIKITHYDATNNDKVVTSRTLRFPKKPERPKYYALYNTYQQEYLYAADYDPYDGDRRNVFTWRRKNQLPMQGIWELHRVNGQTQIYNIYQDEYLYAADYDPYDSDRRRVFTWRPGNKVNQGNWILNESASATTIYNTYQGEYLYAADYDPYDSDRRRVFTWRPGNQVNQGFWMLRPIN